MIIKKIVLLIAVIFSVHFLSCSDSPSSIGEEFLSDDLISVKSFDSSIDSTDQSSTFFKEVIPLGNSSRLLLGKFENTKASLLLRFSFTLADSIKEDFLAGEISVLSASLSLTNNYFIGDETAPYDFTIHKVNQFWTPLGFSADSLATLNYDPDDRIISKNITDTLTSIELDTSLVRDWLLYASDATMGSNLGIYLNPSESSQKVLGFEAFSVNGTYYPAVQIVVEKVGAYIDTLTSSIFGDVSIVTGDLPVADIGNIIVQSGLTVNSRLFFDLTVLPEGSVINKAELFLTEDTLKSKVGSTYLSIISAFFVVDSTIDSSDAASVILLNRSGNIFSGDITSYARSWQFNHNNQGIILKNFDRLNGLEKFILYGSDYIDPLLRPKIKITYTLKDGL